MDNFSFCMIVTHKKTILNYLRNKRNTIKSWHQRIFPKWRTFLMEQSLPYLKKKINDNNIKKNNNFLIKVWHSFLSLLNGVAGRGNDINLYWIKKIYINLRSLSYIALLDFGTN